MEYGFKNPMLSYDVLAVEHCVCRAAPSPLPTIRGRRREFLIVLVAADNFTAHLRCYAGVFN